MLLFGTEKLANKHTHKEGGQTLKMPNRAPPPPRGRRGAARLLMYGPKKLWKCLHFDSIGTATPARPTGRGAAVVDDPRSRCLQGRETDFNVP